MSNYAIETNLATIAHHLSRGADSDSRSEIESSCTVLADELIERHQALTDQIAALQQTVAAQQVQIDGMQKILIGQPQQPAAPRREPIDVQALFEQYYDEEHGEFERIANPLHPRPDIAAMILLDRLDPGPGLDMISSAGHDQVWLNVDLEKLAAAAEQDDILTLLRCGVLFDEETDSLTMYV